MAFFKIPAPAAQIDFALSLEKARREFLQEALRDTVRRLDIRKIDDELASFAPLNMLSTLAGHGLRGELIFPAPCILTLNPRLLAYYRLLLGFSQKAFYSREIGVASFKSMEEKGRLSEENERDLAELCSALIECGVTLIEGLGAEKITRDLLDDLTLLTLGPQLRGGSNVRRGIAGINTIFQVVLDFVKSNAIEVSSTKIVVLNAAKRQVLIEFCSDPDITIREVMDKNKLRNIIAIEIKAGQDYSNIHNRIGEAEKSHQKARREGFVECWTIVNVDRLDRKKASKESPSTNRFYLISDIVSKRGDEYIDFKNRIISLTGIPTDID